MTAQRAFTLWCDHVYPNGHACHTWRRPGGSRDKPQSAHEVRTEARRFGWRWVKREGRWVDICPDCARKAGLLA